MAAGIPAYHRLAVQREVDHMRTGSGMVADRRVFYRRGAVTDGGKELLYMEF